MELFNQLFYFTYGVIVLILCLGSFAGKNFRASNTGYSYWPSALVLMIISSLSFLLAGFSPQYFLSLANSCLVFSGFATILFIRSWRAQGKNLQLKSFWLGFLIFLFFFLILS